MQNKRCQITHHFCSLPCLLNQHKSIESVLYETIDHKTNNNMKNFDWKYSYFYSSSTRSTQRIVILMIKKSFLKKYQHWIIVYGIKSIIGKFRLKFFPIVDNSICVRRVSVKKISCFSCDDIVFIWKKFCVSDNQSKKCECVRRL